MNKNMLFTLVPLIALGFGLIFTTAATPGHGYVSIPAADFHPTVPETPYYNNGRAIINNSEDPQYYIAPVQLPHGVTVTKVTFYFYDASSVPTDYGAAYLYRYNHESYVEGLASMWTNDSGNSSSYADVIDYPTIDNSEYSYYVLLLLNSNGVCVYSITIEYTNPTSFPLILR